MTTNPKIGIIFLHGSGDTGNGFKQWIESCHNILDRLSDRCIFRFPTAPSTQYTLMAGQKSNVWHDRTQMHISAAEDVDGIMRSVEQIDREIDEILPHVQHVILIGMSMGGHMALQMGFRSRHVITGIVALSCFISTTSPVWNMSVRLPKTLMCHGGSDPMVWCDWGKQTSDRLGCEFKVIPYMGHEICTEEMEYVYQWLTSL